jgi:D-alanine-D-alanine ligase
MDKLTFKDLMARAGVPQVDYVGLRDGDRSSPAERLGTPVFVKPARLGSSVGISKVSSPDELPAALDEAFAHDPIVIVEAMATGLEVECSILGNDEPEASQPGEIVPHAEWYDYGFTPTSVYAKLFEASGIPYSELLDRLVRLAVERHERERSYSF